MGSPEKSSQWRFRPLAGKLRAKTNCRFVVNNHDNSTFPSPCGEIKGQNQAEYRGLRGGFVEFPSPCGEIKGQNPWGIGGFLHPIGSFRPLAGKLRAKTPFESDEFLDFLTEFPSPCGEIKGQNSIREFNCNSLFIPAFPSPCGEIKGQNLQSPPWALSCRFSFRPLAGKLRAKTMPDRHPAVAGVRASFRPLAGKLRAKT